MSIQEKRIDFFDRANRINSNVGEMRCAAVRLAVHDSHVFLQEAFPVNLFITSDSCLPLRPGQRFRIASHFWSDDRNEVMVVLEAYKFAEAAISLSDLMLLLQTGQVASVCGP